MADTIIIKNSTTASSVPTAGQLSTGELAVNAVDGIIYMKLTDGSILGISGNHLYKETDSGFDHRSSQYDVIVDENNTYLMLVAL